MHLHNVIIGQRRVSQRYRYCVKQVNELGSVVDLSLGQDLYDPPEDYSVILNVREIESVVASNSWCAR